MRIIPAILLGGAALLLVTKVAKASNLQNLNFAIGNIKIGWEGLSPIIDLTILAQNPTNQQYTLRSIVGNVYLNGQYIGNLSSFTVVDISPVSQKPITIRIKLLGVVIASQIFDIINGNAGVQAKVKVDGKINVDNVLFPLAMEYKIV